MSDEPEDARRFRRSEAFFGRRKTRGLTGRKATLANTLLPELLVNTTGPEIAPTNLFKRPVSAVNIEIGFGGGEHLAQRAATEPDIGFIGVEPFINGMAKMLGEIERRGLRNVGLYDEDAVELLDWLPACSVDRIDLLYPDPWPKRKQWKRRFVNARNLSRIARALKMDGEFRFASDITTYVDWTLLHAAAEPHLDWTAESVSDWNEPWSAWHRTRYERKAIREDRTPAYLRFRKV